MLLLLAPNGTFYIDRYGNECIQEAVAREALLQQFQFYPADIVERLKSRLGTYAETVGTIWVPVYGAAEIVLAEWEDYRDNARKDIEMYFLKANAEYNGTWNFENFCTVVQEIIPDPNKHLVAKIFRQIIRESKGHIEKLDLSLCSKILIQYGITSFYYSALFSAFKIVENRMLSLDCICDVIFDSILKNSWKAEKYRIAKQIDEDYRSTEDDKEKVTGLIGLLEEMNKKTELDNATAEERNALFRRLITESYPNDMDFCILTGGSYP